MVAHVNKISENVGKLIQIHKDSKKIKKKAKANQKIHKDSILGKKGFEDRLAADGDKAEVNWIYGKPENIADIIHNNVYEGKIVYTIAQI